MDRCITNVKINWRSKRRFISQFSFSQNEFDIEAITIFVKSNQRNLKFQGYDVQTSFNRNLIFLDFKDQTLKTEFTYFPFPQKDLPQTYNNLPVDTLTDIALNKLFSIYQNPRLRDFMDLYKILLKQKYNFNQLILDSKVKFDWHIDKLQLGSQLLKAKTQADVPRLIADFDFDKMERFYEEQAKKLGQEITN